MGNKASFWNTVPMSRRQVGMRRSPPLGFNDACVVGKILEPRLFDCEMMRVGIETDDLAEIGRTRQAGARPNANLAVAWAATDISNCSRELCPTVCDHQAVALFSP